MYHCAPFPKFPKRTIHKLFKNVSVMSLCSILTQLVGIKDAYPLYLSVCSFVLSY